MSRRDRNEYENFEYKGYTVRIVQDEDVDDPDEDDGNDEVFLSAETRNGRIGRVGHAAHGACHVRWGEFMWGGFGKQIPVECDEDDEENWPAWELYSEWLDQYEPNYEVWPIQYGEVHGPGSYEIREVQDDDRFDVEDIQGYVYVKVPVNDIEKLADAERDIEKLKDGLIKHYEMWLRGEVYGFIIEDSDGEELESCWSFWGDESCSDEAKHIIDTYSMFSEPKGHYKFVVIDTEGKFHYRHEAIPLYVGDSKMIDWVRDTYEIPDEYQVEEQSTSLPLFKLLEHVE